MTAGKADAQVNPLMPERDALLAAGDRLGEPQHPDVLTVSAQVHREKDREDPSLPQRANTVCL